VIQGKLRDCRLRRFGWLGLLGDFFSQKFQQRLSLSTRREADQLLGKSFDVFEANKLLYEESPLGAASPKGPSALWKVKSNHSPARSRSRPLAEGAPNIERDETLCCVSGTVLIRCFDLTGLEAGLCGPYGMYFMSDEDDWLGDTPLAHFVRDNWLSRRRPLPDEDDWLDLKSAIALIIQSAGFSTGAAQVALHRACSSEEVRSRGRIDAAYSDVRVLSAGDWRGSRIELWNGTLDIPKPFRVIFDVKINSPDLNWWLRNRWSAETVPGDPSGQAQQDRRNNLLDGGGSVLTRTGAPGRPSKGMQIINAEFERRRREHSCLPSLREEANWLQKWFKQAHPTAQHPTLKTIENRIRRDYHAREASSPADDR
jgi:hypothetical protein